MSKTSFVLWLSHETVSKASRYTSLSLFLQISFGVKDEFCVGGCLVKLQVGTLIPFFADLTQCQRRVSYHGCLMKLQARQVDKLTSLIFADLTQRPR